MVNFVYLVGDRETGEAIAIDPAYGVRELVDVLAADGMRLTDVLVTHYHPDHVGGDLGGWSIEGLAELLALPDVNVKVHVQSGGGVRREAGDRRVGLRPRAALVGRHRARQARCRSRSSTRRATRRARNASSSTVASSPATRSSSTAAGAPIFPAAIRRAVREPHAEARGRPRRRDPLPRPHVLARAVGSDGRRARRTTTCSGRASRAVDGDVRQRRLLAWRFPPSSPRSTSVTSPPPGARPAGRIASRSGSPPPRPRHDLHAVGWTGTRRLGPQPRRVAALHGRDRRRALRRLRPRHRRNRRGRARAHARARQVRARRRPRELASERACPSRSTSPRPLAVSSPADDSLPMWYTTRMRTSARWRTARSVAVAALTGCSSTSSETPRPATTTTADANQRRAPASFADLSHESSRSTRPAFAVQPDAAYDTGPSDLAKAIRDDGSPDAGKVLRAEKFVRGYQRIWIGPRKSADHRVRLPVRMRTGARQDYTRERDVPLEAASRGVQVRRDATPRRPGTGRSRIGQRRRRRTYSSPPGCSTSRSTATARSSPGLQARSSAIAPTTTQPALAHQGVQHSPSELSAHDMAMTVNRSITMCSDDAGPSRLHRAANPCNHRTSGARNVGVVEVTEARHSGTPKKTACRQIAGQVQRLVKER